MDEKRMSSLGCDFSFFFPLFIFFPPLMFYSGQQVYTQLILLCFQSLYQCPWEHPGSSWMAFIEVILVRWALLGQWRSQVHKPVIWFLPNGENVEFLIV